MIRPLQACALALCVVAAPSLHAATFTAYAENHLDLAPQTPPGPVTSFGATAIDWEWSSGFTGALEYLGFTPPYVHIPEQPPVFTGNPFAPFSLASVTVDGPDSSGNLTVLSEQLRGSIYFTSNANLLTARATTLTLSDLRIDHQSNQVFARVSDSQSGAVTTDVAIFQFDDTAFVLSPGDYSQDPACSPTNPQCISRLNVAENHPTLHHLQFTGQGRALWDQTFALTPIGRMTMNSVDNLGTLSAAPVPEPSTWALMGIGLVGIGLARRRQAS